MKILRFVSAAFATFVALHGQEPRLANLSTRGLAGTGDGVLTAGFVVAPGASKQVLLRAVGPTLGTAFNVPGALANPVLTLFGPNSATVIAATNDNWGTPAYNGAANAATLTASFSAVGAFPLPNGSSDSAILISLAPGSYTAQVAGANNTSGLALVEVYEVGSTGTQLVNISSRAQVGTGANVMIPGIVISPGSGMRRLLVRAAGPALSAFGLSGALPDPTITVTNSAGVTVASNDNWSTPAGAGAATAAMLTNAFTQAGAFAFGANSRDAALLVDLGAGNYSVQVSGVGGATGLALVEVYDVTPRGPATVTLSATKTSADESGSLAGEFTITRSGETLLPLTVLYGVTGSATNGVDYPALVGFATIPAGASSLAIPLQPFPDTTRESTETVTLTLVPGSAYTIGSAASGTVSIADSPGTLYVATLRPASGATGSAASGLATIVVSASGTVAAVHVSFSNLSSGQAGAHLFVGDSNAEGDYVLNLPLGQIEGAIWHIQPTGTYTSTHILDALRNGRIFVALDTAKYPSGELRGAFLTATGSQAFTAPAAPPAVNLSNVTATDAARFLTQATFGPKRSEIDALTGASIDAWITQQLAAAPTLHRPRELAEYEAVKEDARLAGQSATQVAQIQNSLGFRRRVWYPTVITAEDQLRQRVAFALSQILVVGDDPFGNNHTDGLTNYYDTLVRGAFGSYRTLLEQVTLNPIMGIYLSSLRNAKANPATGTFPDENYAREVMQLFSIGLLMLHPDGTLKLDDQGLPIASYDNTTITEMAKVFTGWGYYTTRANPSFRGTAADYINPMMLYPAEHDNTEKRLVNGVVLPAGQSGVRDLADALDALVNHPNCAPFVSRQLIQRLVTDNPSPGYVYRVAQVFEREKAGSNQLGAVVRAILTDYEARSPDAIGAPGYGKLKEPLLRFTAILRSFNAGSASGRNLLENSPYTALRQGPLESPSVFNFFEPGYVYPGALAAAGLVAPEFQITDDTTAITVPNYLRSTIYATATGANAAKINTLHLAAEEALASNPAELVDHLGLVMTANQLGAAARARILAAVNAVTNSTNLPRERAQTAILLIATSLDGATQR